MKIKVSRTFDSIYKAYISGLYRLIVAYGSSRSGKSYSIMQLFCMILMQKTNYKITVWRGTRVDAVGTILEDFKAVVQSDPEIDAQFVFNKKDATFKCKKTQSVIHFMGTDNISKVLGMRQDISFFNEISHFSEEVYLQIVQRTMDVVFSDYNPSRDFFISKYQNHDNSIFLRSTYKDNIEFLSEGIVNQLESYNPYEDGSTYVEDGVLMHNGEPVSNENQPPPNKKNIENGTADKYMYEVYCLGIKSEKPNRVYRGWDKCTEEEFYDLPYESYFGLDFGISAPTALIEIKFDGDRTFYLHERLYMPSSQLGMPLYEYLKSFLSPPLTSKDILICDNAKKEMIDDLVSGGLRAVKALKGPGSKYKRISQAQSINIVYTNTSFNLEEEYFNYSYKLDRYGIVTDEIDPANPDHAMDAFGYGVSWLISYLRIVFA